jgi:hypothetical protein
MVQLATGSRSGRSRAKPLRAWCRFRDSAGGCRPRPAGRRLTRPWLPGSWPGEWPPLRARRIPGEPRRPRTLAQVRAVWEMPVKPSTCVYPGSNPGPATQKPRSDPVSGAGANTCLEAVRNTAPFTFRLNVVRVSAVPSPPRDRMTGRPRRIRGEVQALRSRPGGRRWTDEAPWEGRRPRRAAGQCPSGSRAAATSLPPKPGKRHYGP